MTDLLRVVRKDVKDKFIKDEFPKLQYERYLKEGGTKDKDRFMDELKLSDLISNAESNQKMAIEIIRLSVRFLKEADKGNFSIPLPVCLGEYLGTAFEKALIELDNSESINEGKKLKSALSDALHITAKNRRPNNAYEVGAYMLQFIEAGESISEAARLTSVDYEASGYNISESTAKKCFNEMATFFGREKN